jgi:hypothetical protein
MSRRWLRFTLCLAICGNASAAVLTTEFADRALIVHGVTPGGAVAVFGLSREPLQTHPVTPATVVRAEILTDTDGDGIVQLTLAVPVPRMGMWAVVDLKSGDSAAFPTPGYEPRLIALVPDLLKNDNAGQLRKVDWPFSDIDMFVARPSVGAWRYYASKASLLDENRDDHNGSLRIDVANMTPIGSSPDAPHNFHKGDVVAVFDRREMQYGILEVGH